MNQDRMQFKAIDRDTKEVIDITGFNLPGKVAKKYSTIHIGYKVENLANVDIIQSIGKRDKNNELIFDGDIVITFDGEIGVICFGEYNMWHFASHKGSYGYFIDWYMGKGQGQRKDLLFWLNDPNEGLEVIGHKLTHPELLENS